MAKINALTVFVHDIHEIGIEVMWELLAAQMDIIDDLPEEHANHLREVEDKQKEAKVVCGLSFRQVISHIVSCR